jgi:hypothetical protein
MHRDIRALSKQLLAVRYPPPACEHAAWSRLDLRFARRVAVEKAAYDLEFTEARDRYLSQGVS